MSVFIAFHQDNIPGKTVLAKILQNTEKYLQPENFTWCSNIGNINLRLSPNAFPC